MASLQLCARCAAMNLILFGLGGLCEEVPVSADAQTLNCSRPSLTLREPPEQEFLNGASGKGNRHGELPSVMPYPIFLGFLSLLMGLGKGGIPGMSTSSVALNSLYAPDGCLDLATALQVPVCFCADVTVAFSYIQHARWPTIIRLLPFIGLGIAIGTQLMGRLSAPQSKLLVGSILLSILLLNLAQEMSGHLSKLTSMLWPSKKGKDAHGKQTDAGRGDVPSYANSFAFACLVGVVGGFATILTNAMGPMLNIFLLTLKLEPTVFVGTRGTLFTVVNALKLAQRLQGGTLSADMVILGLKQGIISVVGVLIAKLIVKRMSKSLFMKLEYTLMTYASLKLLHAGLS
eukprot:TRINITY_DN65050_c0_g1_i1.p1 TRINITY_DN65050_c0_g1~~TRINITY_DN65050_c0_g1_i1.p1  ORF type:complete len:356 (+),score=39.61 TRINITY_DN65050_c0_g1_i1:31-1068(+)